MYYQWYLSHLQERIDYLSSVVSRELAIPKADLDLSPRSLILVWSWFLSTTVPELDATAGAADQDKRRIIRPERDNVRLVDHAEKPFSLIAEYICRDIGMYLGEVFTKNEQGIYWSYYESPKSDLFVNMPVLLGFEDSKFTPAFQMVFEPTHMVKIQAANIQDHTQHAEDLFNLYCKWATAFIPNRTRGGCSPPDPAQLNP